MHLQTAAIASCRMALKVDQMPPRSRPWPRLPKPWAGPVNARTTPASTRAATRAAAARGPLVLAGSRLGAYIAGRVSLEVPVLGLFLMAPPISMGPLQELDASPVSVSIIHGWDDELIPAQHVVDWATPRRARLLLVNDSHRLSEHVEASAEAFAALLKEVQP